MLRVAVIMLGLILLPSTATAADRYAILIGNQHYRDNVGPLTNPHNDIALIGAALERLGFKITTIKDAGYKAIETAIKTHIQNVRRAGRDTISIIYYSGHGASDPDTKINYLIPVDVDSADDASLWTNSIELNELVNKLRTQSPEAIHYLVFDACREELHLTREGKKAMGSEKGFVPMSNIAGVMIAYATAPGKTASDMGENGGVYAKALSEEIVKPGIESVTMFRSVQLKVKQAIGQDPWLSLPPLPAVYFAGSKSPEQLDLAFWLSVKDSTSPAVLATYLERYPNGEFAAIARTLTEHYERKIKAEQAAQEEERKRIEEERKAAEVKRLEEERWAREAAIADQRKRAEESKSGEEARRLEEQQRAELVARTEELRKAVEEARLAREAAKAAEEQRVAAIKAAEEATRVANEAISLKRDTETPGDPAKVAALPKLEIQKRSYDGQWQMLRLGPNCGTPRYTPTFVVKNGIILGNFGAGGVRGAVSSDGAFRLTHLSTAQGGGTLTYSGTVTGNTGKGTFKHRPGPCGGTFTLRRQS
jgi:hypothetical protein